ncbi:hypothetical protein BTW01_01815 [Bacillus sp. SKDU12]|nr:hypothetical protein BTW01_01815 [Bacillus sp. SKDU12]
MWWNQLIRNIMQQERKALLSCQKFTPPFFLPSQKTLKRTAKTGEVTIRIMQQKRNVNLLEDLRHEKAERCITM